MILNDRQIRERCLPPRFMKTVLVPQPQDPQYAVYICPREEEVPTYQTEDELKKEILNNSRTRVGTIHYRPLTEQELLAFHPMIEPFKSTQIRTRMEGFGVGERLISYGLSSFGYDIRCADEFKVFTNINSTVVDPKNFDPQSFVEVSGKGYCVIPPNSFALARTVERFRIPRDVMTVCLGKSTYARCGIVVNVTPFEPGWEGYVTLEFSNTTPLPAKIYADEGCAQVLFFKGQPCEVSYADRKGKYQMQEGVTLPKT